MKRMVEGIPPSPPAPRAGRGAPTRFRSIEVLAAVLGSTLLLGACARTPAPAAQGDGLQGDGLQAAAAPAVRSDLGPNVTVFDPAMPVAQIQAALDAAHARQVNDEMGSGRYAFLFRPGTYGTPQQPLQIKVGYYTEIAGLGATPGDVVINGKLEVYNRCLGDGGTSNCIALNNFWRTASNLTVDINALGQDGCRASANFWAVSQATSLRRVEVRGGNLSLMDYCTAGPQFASGGFIADSKLPFVINGSQQQWLTRNSAVAGWSNGVWNQVFSGVEGAPSEAGFPNPPYTTLDTTPVSREKPYLYVDGSGAYQVRVPVARTNTRGLSWGTAATAGRTLPLSDFFVARPGDSVQVINTELARGRHLLLTPGLYDVPRSILVKRADTVVLGLGHATLTSTDGATPLRVADVPGVVIAGVTLDAGPAQSELLLQIGTKNGNNGAKKNDHANPTTLSDVYFRVGGPHIGKVDTALEVNSDHVLIDHIWVWRADHGTEGFTQGVNGDTDRWRTNIGRQGVVVNGNDVTATGLFVEHFQQYNTVWNGERGNVVLYQNELPYDPPTQMDWMNGPVLGWAGYKVADGVRTHSLQGGGVYVFNQNNPSIVTENGFEVPRTPGVRLRHIMTVNLSAGTIKHVVNGVGAAVDTSRVGQPEYVVSYP
ncbi:glycosyl hydrolase family 28-related protein [Deinococcus koreensis]|uniref:Adenylyl cyclase n=1 Tax=Deinococcus koreensis TaxID=2054903 RepID=A0A2K3V143_9DEIO|nr:glycosyl hydrolase family 28-related protein [Deinococcus koreensis]PNY82499.1 adenylyl cyclase [Deinococcus koreensis]